MAGFAGIHAGERPPLAATVLDHKQGAMRLVCGPRHVQVGGGRNLGRGEADNGPER